MTLHGTSKLLNLFSAKRARRSQAFSGKMFNSWGSQRCWSRRFSSHDLPALFIQIVAIVAQPVSARTVTAFRLGYVPARRTSVVIMMNAFIRWFLNFVDGIEFRYFRHIFPFVRGCPNANARRGIINRSFETRQAPNYLNHLIPTPQETNKFEPTEGVT
jgi:hypothetical protein